MADNAPEQIIINGQEFSMDDAAQLVELGNKYKELEGNLNTSLDKVVPEYTKATQRLKGYEGMEQELAVTKQQLEEFQKKQLAAETPEEVAKARQAARELGLADKDWITEEGYIKKSDLDEYFTKKQEIQFRADNILKDCQRLEKEVDGSDGRVPFDTDAVLTYASVKNIADPMEAYTKMNSRGNAKWEQAEIEKAQKPGLTTMRANGKKTPEPVKVNNDNFSDLLRETIYGDK